MIKIMAVMVIKIIPTIFNTILMHSLPSAVSLITIARVIKIATLFTTILIHTLLSFVPWKNKNTHYVNDIRQRKLPLSVFLEIKPKTRVALILPCNCFTSDYIV